MRTFFTRTDPVLRGQVSRVLATVAIEQGADPDELFAGAGMTLAFLEHSEARLSFDQYTVLVRNALRLTGNPALGIDVGKRISFPQLGLLGLAIMGAGTVRGALEYGVKYARQLMPLYDVTMNFEGSRVILTFRESIRLLDVKAYSAEVLLVSMHTAGSMLLGRPIPVRRVAVDFPCPPYIEQLHELSPGTIFEFDKDRIEVELDPAVLVSRFRIFPSPATTKLVERYVALDTVNELGSIDDNRGVVGQIRAVLDATPGAPPTCDEMAKKLRTSGRTLRRVLQSMDTTYQDLVDESRRDRALELVTSSSLSFDEIAERLGFSNLRSMRRAFQRWTGRTPSEVRKESQAGLSVERDAAESELIK